MLLMLKMEKTRGNTFFWVLSCQSQPNKAVNGLWLTFLALPVNQDGPLQLHCLHSDEAERGRGSVMSTGRL